MALYNDMQQLIGNTPLVKLNHIDLPDGANLYAKLELFNPSGSVKDRIGKYMIEDAEKRGILKQGGTIVEATAGNTGLGIAFAALNKGYKSKRSCAHSARRSSTRPVRAVCSARGTRRRKSAAPFRAR